jgi:hypothetical protein
MIGQQLQVDNNNINNSYSQLRKTEECERELVGIHG